MVENFINTLKDFSVDTPYIESIIIVGSCARGMNKEYSDLDIVIISPNKSELCSLEKGWNIKFKKARKTLCTIYHSSVLMQ